MIDTVKQLSLLLLNIETARAEALVEGCMKSVLGGQGWWVCWHRSHETEVQSGVLPRVDEWEERITQVYRNT